ncbi:MAG TPA: hypothetical protein ENN54_06515 [Thermoplasmatales archaeon]|nr:hypothetical protein [Thermoplasmatales archaeon]
MRGVALVSGGIDSPVALYVMARHMECLALHMDTRPFLPMDERGKVASLVRRVAEAAGRQIPLWHVPFGEVVQRAIAAHTRPHYHCLLCKRMMYRVAAALAGQQRASVVVTGENLGQVASQTLHNLRVLEESIDLPVVRPLIGLDKQEIVDLARHIGTYQLSIEEAPSCLLVPDAPATAAALEAVHAEEENLDVAGLTARALKEARMEKL